MQKLFTILLCLSLPVALMAQSKSTVSHQVAKGETLYSISKQYHVTVEAIEKTNKLSADVKIKIGQKLLIPSSSATANEKVEAAPSQKPKAEGPPKSSASAAPSAAASDDASTHIVAKGETVYGIARANGLTPKQLKDANHLSDDMKLKLGQRLIIPSKNQEAMYQAPAATSQPKPAPVAANSEPSRDYLNTSATPAKKEEVHPAATTPVATPDPVPVAKKDPPPPVKPTPPAKNEGDENPFVVPGRQPASENVRNENTDPGDYISVFNNYSSSGKKKMVYRGISVFMQSENPGNQFLALYNYAEMGSILKVTNLMSKESIYVKVIGKVPATDTKNDIILKVSSDAANRLKVTEDKFLVEVTGYNAE